LTGRTPKTRIVRRADGFWGNLAAFRCQIAPNFFLPDFGSRADRRFPPSPAPEAGETSFEEFLATKRRQKLLKIFLPSLREFRGGQAPKPPSPDPSRREGRTLLWGFWAPKVPKNPEKMVTPAPGGGGRGVGERACPPLNLPNHKKMVVWTPQKRFSARINTGRFLLASQRRRGAWTGDGCTAPRSAAPGLFYTCNF
jgi:hypothetical protein